MKEAPALIDTLKSQGHRMTKLRQGFAEVMSAAEHPLSASQIIENLCKKKIVVNKTSIYREIDFLLKQRLIKEIDILDGKKRYELRRADDHHHHLVCTKCDKISCVKMAKDLDALEKHLERHHDFKITGHVLEFFGLCSSCR